MEGSPPAVHEAADAVLPCRRRLLPIRRRMLVIMAVVVAAALVMHVVLFAGVAVVLLVPLVIAAVGPDGVTMVMLVCMAVIVTVPMGVRVAVSRAIVAAAFCMLVTLCVRLALGVRCRRGLAHGGGGGSSRDGAAVLALDVQVDHQGAGVAAEHLGQRHAALLARDHLRIERRDASLSA